MITAIVSLGQVRGAEIWLVGWLVCMAAYFAILLLWKCNRTRQGVKNLIFWFLAVEFITDLAWALVYYGNPGYINYGVAAVYGLLLWPVALLLGGVVALAQNKRNRS